ADLTASNPDIVDECRSLINGHGVPAARDAAPIRVESTDVDAHVALARRVAGQGAIAVCLDGPAGRDAVMDRLDVAERVRTLLGDSDAHDDLTVGLLTNRTDFVEIR